MERLLLDGEVSGCLAPWIPTKKIEDLEEVLSTVLHEEAALSEAACENASLATSWEQMAVARLRESEAIRAAVVAHALDIDEKMAKRKIEVEENEPTAGMKMLDSRIDELKKRIDHVKEKRRETEQRVRRLQQKHYQMEADISRLKANTKLDWYKNLCPIEWIQWKEVAGQPGITVVGRFKWTESIEDNFSLVIACSAECSSGRVVENVDWVWAQLEEIQFPSS